MSQKGQRKSSTNSPRRPSHYSPSTSKAADQSPPLQPLQDFPDIWGGDKQNPPTRDDDGVDSNMELVGKSQPFASNAWYSTPWARKALKDPGFIKLLNRIKADVQATASAPLRKIVILYHSEKSLYQFDEVMLHTSVYEHLDKIV